MHHRSEAAVMNTIEELTYADRKAAWDRGRPVKGWTVLTEEVLGVEEDRQWFIHRFGEPTLWYGSTKQAGLDWAEENKIVIDDIEYFEGG
jgi:hypothetical protein